MRGGIRLENAKSHFEAGFEGGWERGALNEIVTSAGTCFPMPKESPEYCLSQQTPPIANIDQVRETRDRRGFYIDWAWTTALMHGWKYIVQNQAEWFPFDASGDNSSDTRYRYDLTNKFSIPLLKSLSFQPGVEYFRYRNEFGTTYLARWSPSASLSWSFDVYSGGKLGKELSYKPGGDDSEK